MECDGCCGAWMVTLLNRSQQATSMDPEMQPLPLVCAPLHRISAEPSTTLDFVPLNQRRTVMISFHYCRSRLSFKYTNQQLGARPIAKLATADWTPQRNGSTLLNRIWKSLDMVPHSPHILSALLIRRFQLRIA
jgi:hypothetical protein